MEENLSKEIKSEYIRNKINGMKWNKRGHINDLIFFEKWVSSDGELGLSAGWKFDSLIKNFKKEFEIIYEELKPKEFKKYIKKEAQKRENVLLEESKFNEQRAKEEAQAKEEWFSFGGK